VPEFPDINAVLCRKKLTPKHTLASSSVAGGVTFRAAAVSQAIDFEKGPELSPLAESCGDARKELKYR